MHENYEQDKDPEDDLFEDFDDNFYSPDQSANNIANILQSFLHKNPLNNIWQYYLSNKGWAIINQNHLPTIYNSKYAWHGINCYKEGVWKSKYLVKDDLYIAYKNHISSHAAHITRQPTYYKGLFDIMN